MFRIFFLISCLCLSALCSQAQSVVHGRVLGQDSLSLPGVSIQNIRSRHITISNNEGVYDITARPGDTILFTAIGYIPYSGRAGSIPPQLYLHPQIITLKGVEVLKRNHIKDSLELREEYGKAFNFRRPKFREVVMITPLGIGVNINKLYKALSFANNKRSLTFKKRLINFEHDQFIDQRFTPDLIAKYTGLDGDSLQLFINRYKPDYRFATEASQYDFIVYIKEACERFRRSSIASEK